MVEYTQKMKQAAFLIFFLALLLPLKSFAKDDSTELEIKRIKVQISSSPADSTKGRLLLRLAVLNYEKNNSLAIDYINQAIQIANNSDNSALLGRSYYLLGTITTHDTEKDKALDYLLKGLKLFEKLGDEVRINDGYLHIANYFYDIGAYEKAIEYYKKLIVFHHKRKDKNGESIALNNIGVSFQQSGDLNNAILYLKMSIKLYEELGSKNDIAETSINIGNVYYRQGELMKAKEEYEKALPILTETGNSSSLAICRTCMGVILNELKQPEEAIPHSEEAIKIFKKMGNLDYLSIVYYNYSNSFKLLGNHKTANKYLEMHINLNDSLSNTYLMDQIAEMSEKYEADKKQQEIELLMEDKKNTDQRNKIQELENQNQKAELSKSNTVVYFSIGGLVLLMAFAFMLIKRIRLKSVIFRQLKQQKEEILFAKQIIEAKNKDILDSILYAKKIQDAILHEENKALKNLDQHFVIFRPKDIVSGDFYWTLEKNECVYAAVADCTGHGVPGAFMSMLGIAFLNEITKSGELKSPAEILNELRTKVIRELGQSGTIGENKDGMDISLVKIDRKRNSLEFSGAHNPLLISRKNEIIQLNADKQPIGYQEEQKPFTNQFLELQSGDMMYLLSDGYADQFGGDLTVTGKIKGKKFKMTRFKELIQKISDIETGIQKTKIEKAFFDWKGDMEQIDDVCVMGIKI